MFRSLNVAATGMSALETQLDTIANNIANSNTSGYKRQEAEFEDLLYQTLRGPTPNADGGTSPSAVQLGSGTRIVATTRSFAQGSVQQTGNPLDLAIEGAGFLRVTQANGEPAFTRAGHLKLDAQGRLVTADGLAVEPPISIPADATRITIAQDGTVSVEQPGQSAPSQLGQLQLATFTNPGGLTAIGHNLFVASGASGEPSVGNAGAEGRGTFMQGALEGSNVEVVTEMIGLIRTQRAYEVNSKVIAAADEMLRNATQTR
jgi:flagellar basal-body rod protein FlgG